MSAPSPPRLTDPDDSEHTKTDAIGRESQERIQTMKEEEEHLRMDGERMGRETLSSGLGQEWD